MILTKSNLEAIGRLDHLRVLLLLRLLRDLVGVNDLRFDIDISIIIQLGLSSVDHPLENDGCRLAIVGLLFGLIELLLDLLVVCQLIFNCLLSEGFFSFLIRDLSDSSSSLGAALQHVGSVTLRGCM